MQRRELLLSVAVSAVVRPVAGLCGEGLPEIGFLHQGSPEPEVLMSSFGKGFDDSRVSVDHVKIEHRWADGEYDRLPGLPKDLVDRESP